MFPALLLLTVLQGVRCWRTRQAARWRGVALSAGALFLFSWPPFAWVMSHAFESQYPLRTFPVGEAEAIVVLASSVQSPGPLPTPRLGDDTYERCQYAAFLYRSWKPLPVIAIGGVPSGGPGTPYADVMRVALEKEGVAASSISVEERSRSTFENALYGADLLRSKPVHRILLITDSYHMLRAAACFRKQALTVVPGPCNFRTYNDLHWKDLLPAWESISWNEDIVHECVALVYYRLRGWI